MIRFASPDDFYEDGTPRRKTPLYMWVLAAAVAGFAGFACTSLVNTVVIAGLVISLGVGLYLLARPMNTIIFSLIFYPFYLIARTVQLAYLPGVSLGIIGMWPELALCVLCMTCIVQSSRDRSRRLQLTWYDIPVLLLVLAAGYGTLLSVQLHLYGPAVYGVHYSATSMLFYFAARWAKPTAQDLRRLVFLLLAVFVIIAIPSFIDYVIRTDFSIHVATVVRPYGKEFNKYYFWKFYPRMQSLMFDENLWGCFCAYVSCVTLALVTVVPARTEKSRHPMKIGWYVVLYFVATLGLLLSMSRGALACWFVSNIALFAMQTRRRGRFVAIASVFVLTALVAFAVLRNNTRMQSMVERILALTDTSSRVAYDRVDMWKTAIGVFQENPAGVGIGIAGQANALHGGVPIVTDGYYFRVLAEFGIVGILLYVFGLSFCVFCFVRLLKGAQGIERVVGLSATAFFCGMLAQNVGSNALDFYFMPFVLWTMLGLFVTRRFEQAKEAIEAERAQIQAERDSYLPVIASDAGASGHV